MRHLDRAFKIAKIVTGIFFFMLVMIVVSASMPYVAKPGVEAQLWLFFTTITLFGFLTLLVLYKGTTKQPAGFALLANKWKQRDFVFLLKVVLAILFGAALLGYSFAVFFEVTPAYPTKLLVKNSVITPSVCLRSGRDKIRGSWSVFELPSKEQWKIAGFGRICEKAERQCELKYLPGYFGYYVEGVRCE